MKTAMTWVILFTLILGTAYVSATDHNVVTLEGTLVSSACYTGGGATTNDMGGKKGCGSACLRKGDPGALVTKEGEFHVLVVSSFTLAPYVGQQVLVSGKDFNGAISVDKVEVSKDGQWHQIELKRGNDR